MTSRTRLLLHGEHLIPVGGLSLDQARQLFAVRAAAIEPQFSATPHHDSMTRICQAVEGLPLGIELAARWVRAGCALGARWVRHLPVHEIADSVEEATSQLEDPQHRELASDDGNRGHHNSLRAVFEHSWRLLGADEKKILAQASLFAGSFEREAAQRVMNASLRTLSFLIDHSLLQRVYAGRYELHQVIREFAAQKLADAPSLGDLSLHEATTQAYCEHYLSLLISPDHAIAPNAFNVSSISRHDIDNMRAAWLWAVERNQFERLAQAVNGFAVHLRKAGLLRDSLELTRKAIDATPAYHNKATFPEKSAMLNIKVATNIAGVTNEDLAILIHSAGWQSLVLEGADEAILGKPWIMDKKPCKPCSK